jgi:hypothetical protein
MSQNEDSTDFFSDFFLGAGDASAVEESEGLVSRGLCLFCLFYQYPSPQRNGGSCNLDSTIFIVIRLAKSSTGSN